MTMENDARCSGGGGDGDSSEPDDFGDQANTPPAAAPSNINLDNEDSLSQDHTNNNTAASTSHALAPSSREMRNRAEKQRRDKLNTYICELAELNPLIANVDKKMDKTSVLRLSAAYLRLHRTVWHCERVASGAETGCCVTTPTSSSSGTELAIVKKTTSNNIVKSQSNGSSISNNNNRIARPNRIYNIDFPVPMDLSEQMLEDMEGFLLILTAAGKVVFVSHNVTRVLGHAQNDLMGQSIYNITDPLDHESLRRNLHPDPSRPGETTNDNSQEKRHRRSFFLKLSQRTTSRAEHAMYELVHVVGQLRVPEHQHETTAPSAPIARKSARTRDGGVDKSHHDCVLVAVVKLAMTCRNELSIMDATKDEYVTRHSLDGLIIYSDHRISVVAGYMAEEVCGNSAFTFMHCEDVELTLTSLKQMYSSAEGFGSSVYRLIATNGDFIYLRTHGHLEYDDTGQKPVSFICVNTLMTEEEGELGRLDMVKRFSALTKHRDSLLNAIKDKEMPKVSLMDKDRLQLLISTQLGPINGPKASQDFSAPDIQYMKCTQFSHSLPPPNVHLAHAEMKRCELSTAGSPSSCELSPSVSSQVAIAGTRVSPNGSLRTTSICSLSPSEDDSPPNSPPVTYSSSRTADPMVAGSPTCLGTRQSRRETTSASTNITLETSVIRQVSPNVEVRRNGRRGRPPRINKRSLSPDGESNGVKKICTEHLIQPDPFWEEELSETNSLLSTATDFSSFDEVDERNSDLQSLMLGDLLHSSGLHTTETETLSTNPPSDNKGPAIQDGSSIHRLKSSSTHGANVGV